MTKLKFVSRRAGTSKTGTKYDLVELSDGTRAVSMENKSNFDFSTVKENDMLDCELGFTVQYGEARPTLITAVKAK